MVNIALMRRALFWLLNLESLIVASLMLYMIALGFTHDKEWAPYLGVIGMALLGAIGLFFLARGVKAGNRRVVAPAILANLIALGVAKYQFEAKVYWLAIPISVMAVIVIVGLFLDVKSASN
jgi:uncharacterized membrane protein